MSPGIVSFVCACGGVWWKSTIVRTAGCPTCTDTECLLFAVARFEFEGVGGSKKPASELKLPRIISKRLQRVKPCSKKLPCFVLEE